MTDATLSSGRSGDGFDSLQRRWALSRPPIRTSWTLACVLMVGALLTAVVVVSLPLRMRFAVPVTIETREAAAQINTTVAGFVASRPVREGQLVAAGQLIGVIGAPEEVAGIALLRPYSAKVNAAAASRSVTALPASAPGRSTGVLGAEVVELEAAIFDLRRVLLEGESETLRNLRRELDDARSRRAELTERVVLAKKLVVLAEQDVAAKKALMAKGFGTLAVVTANERALIDARLKVIDADTAQQDGETAIVHIEQKIAEAARLDQQVVDTAWQKVTLKAQILAAAITAWDGEHSLKAPVAGFVRHFDSPREGQYIPAQANFATIDPVRPGYQVTADLPANQVSRIRVGQAVRISLDGYPERDFGVLSGIVTRISRVARSGQYRVEVQIPSLRLSRGVQAVFVQGMPGRLVIYGSSKPEMRRFNPMTRS